MVRDLPTYTMCSASTLITALDLINILAGTAEASHTACCQRCFCFFVSLDLFLIDELPQITNIFIGDKVTMLLKACSQFKVIKYVDFKIL